MTALACWSTPGCLLDHGHGGDCDMSPRPTSPAPRAHHPFAVGLALLVIIAAGWVVVWLLVMAVISGLVPA